jgi:transcriptional regulator of aromatic amino acid metabolism
MFKSQQYRAKATEFGELVKTSTSLEESREFQKLERRFASLADDEQVLAYDHKSAVHASNQSRCAALAVEEEYVLRCLGAALIMQWNNLPTTLQREVFDAAGSAGKLLETAALRGQIARFLHKHKDDGACSELTPIDGTHSDAAALSRWDDEGGAVRDGLPM